MGLPKYLHGHHPNPLRRGFDVLRKKGYKLVGDVAKLLGVSENTVRRLEAEGVIPKARRVELAPDKSVRAYSARDIARIARSRSRERWRTKQSPPHQARPSGARSISWRRSRRRRLKVDRISSTRCELSRCGAAGFRLFSSGTSD
jgi:hypothetical protein